MDKVNILGSSVDTRNLRFLWFFSIPSLQPYLEVSSLFVLVGAPETTKVCMCSRVFVRA